MNHDEIALTVKAQVIREVLVERVSQDKKFGLLPRNRDPKLWLTILAEEFGEVGRAILESDWENYQKELIQVAAVAIAALEDLRLSKCYSQIAKDRYCRVWHKEQWVSGKILLCPNKNRKVVGCWKVFLFIGSGIDKYIIDPSLIEEVEVPGVVKAKPIMREKNVGEYIDEYGRVVRIDHWFDESIEPFWKRAFWTLRYSRHNGVWLTLRQMWEQLWVPPMTKPIELKSYVTAEGAYIGDREWADYLMERGIEPTTYGDNQVCSIGWCDREQRWYGWSHRAIYGFGIGDVVKEGDCTASSGWCDDYLEECPEKDVSLPVGFVAHTLEDAKRMAIAFADSVS